MNGSLITKYHNNGKKLPRGYLGRNCIISDHFREWRYWWGWEGRPEFAGKVVLSCLFTDRLSQTSCTLSSDLFHLLS